MKKLLLFTLVFIPSTLLIYPQWTNQNPVPDGNDLWSTFFIDDTGWIVGSGIILKTTNAGLDWIEQNGGGKSVYFVDQNTGWICGSGGGISKTTNGGGSWFSLTSGTTENLTDIHFYDTDTGYVVGFSGTILKTTDGGSSWVSQPSGTSNDLYSVDFVDAFVGYAVGGEDPTYSILKTTDGGASWIDKSSGAYVGHYLLAVEFIDANTGFIGGGNTSESVICKTTDGGDTWVNSESKLFFRQIEQGHKEQPSVYNSGGINSIYFKDANIGYAASGDVNGYYRGIFTTTDGGSTWTAKYNGAEQNGLISVYGNNTGKGWAVGFTGVIFITEDDGNSWAQILSGDGSSNWSGDNIYSVFCINENIGWAVGKRNNDLPGVGPIILKTTNGGKIWKTQLFLQSYFAYEISVFYQ